MAEVLTSVSGGLGRLTLNRPDALHALTVGMCAAMTEALLAWKDDPAVGAILIEHAPGTRGFCAGGDIRMLAESGKKDGAEARHFFFTEYQLNHLLMVYPKPVLALMDGVTMGGGVGISLPAKFRVVTERTNFAMPETGIGLFPDVGGGWHLPRLPGKVGLWLALTGARLKGGDCIAAGIGTHYMASERLERVRAAAESAAGMNVPLASLAGAVTALAQDPGAPKELAPENRDRIDRLFAGESVAAIFRALAEDGSDWAKAQLATLETKSPQTLEVAFRQLAEGEKAADFAANMRMEFRIAARVAQRHDFLEGVRAVIIDKDNAPRWFPPTLAGVTGAMLDEIFAPLPADQEWTPLPALS
ncbi:MAG: enoyl-CoA hydratase/isomerase family protein [Hyphomonadaceae bacterium]